MPTHFRGEASQVRALDTYIKLSRASDSIDSRLAAALAREGLTTGQLGVLEALLHPAGSEASPEVTVNPLAGFPSSVVKVTLTVVLLPEATASGFWLGVPTTLSFVVARYGTLNDPVFDSPALFWYA